MKLFRVQLLVLSVFLFVGWVVMQQPSASAGQPAQASSEQPSVTPQQGQTADQQKKDLAECYDIAKAKTGIDPAALISKKIPGLSEAASATQAGAAGGNQSTAPPAASGQAPASADKQAKLDKFQIANQACLKARGYLVKGQAPTATPAAEQPK